LNRLEYIKRLITHEVELAADEVIQRRSGALIGEWPSRCDCSWLFAAP
jgi:hypothetical protein